MSGVRKGWCPTLSRPMETGDGWLVRVPLRWGRMTAVQARAIAAIAGRCGNGHIDLTARGNLQLRGITPERYDDAVAALAALGLAEEPAMAIVINPLAGIDPACAEGIEAFALRLERAVDAEGLALPSKFFCVADGGGIIPMGGIAADVYCSYPQDFDNAMAAIRLQVQRGCDKRAQAGFAAPAPGYMLLAGNGVVAVAVPFGRMEVEAMLTLAEIAEQAGDGSVRLAPWRMMLIPQVAVERAGEALLAAAQAGFITAAHDARLAIQACPGAPACASAEGQTRGLALALAAALPDLAASGRSMHVSGCAKGCAKRGKTDITVTARQGGYDLAFDAAAGEHPRHSALDSDSLIAILTQRELP
jgi:precorrin-3B synthase